jgi:hypothetical protein
VYIVAIHDISDSEKFWQRAQETAAAVPEGIKLHQVFPNTDGTRATCLWEADRVEKVQKLLDDVVGQYAHNETFEVQRGTAIGLPA